MDTIYSPETSCPETVPLFNLVSILSQDIYCGKGNLVKFSQPWGMYHTIYLSYIKKYIMPHLETLIPFQCLLFRAFLYPFTLSFLCYWKLYDWGSVFGPGSRSPHGEPWMNSAREFTLMAKKAINLKTLYQPARQKVHTQWPSCSCSFIPLSSKRVFQHQTFLESTIR